MFGEGEGGYSGWSTDEGGSGCRLQGEGWTLHDLRRTAATRMADIGMQPHVIEAVLNHVSGHKAGRCRESTTVDVCRGETCGAQRVGRLPAGGDRQGVRRECDHHQAAKGEAMKGVDKLQKRLRAINDAYGERPQGRGPTATNGSRQMQSLDAVIEHLKEQPGYHHSDAEQILQAGGSSRGCRARHECLVAFVSRKRAAPLFQ